MKKKENRSSGILMPVSSLPSSYGIGTFSKEAYQFVDFLKKAGQKYWQILPLGPTGYGDSPYQSFSTFAGNPYFIDLDQLVEQGYLKKEECNAYEALDALQYIDYEKLYLTRYKLLKAAYKNKDVKKEKGYEKFIEENSYWLEDYALFMAVKESFGGKSWIEWDEDIRIRKGDAIERYKKECGEEVDFYRFIQYQFSVQWHTLKEYANKKGIEIIGDIPIYVAYDSADVWANRELFELDDKGIPIEVAGCPPDAFSKEGQLWGNPLYRWDYHKQTNYRWWIQRMAYCFEMYDVVRIDHFRGFDEFYAIPYDDKTAEFGTWKKGPGYEFFDVLKKTLGNKEVIAEDLGFLTESVIELVQRTGYPGMKVLQFAFDSREESDYLPHNYEKNCVVYTGTHDNDTILGWYKTMTDKDRAFAEEYLNMAKADAVNWIFIRAAFGSVANTVIIPLQDYLGLGSEGRINRPSSVGTNWRWRSLPGEYTEKLAEEILKITKLYGRF